MILHLQTLRPDDVDAIVALGGGNGWSTDPARWARYLAEQADGHRLVRLAWSEDRPVGYGSLRRQPDYAPFRTSGIPEINDLCVAAGVRRRGIAMALIRAFEDLARQEGHREIGLGVGLYADYGPAQRLYARLGHRPDGRGVTSGGRSVPPGETVRLDDELILWLTKPLQG